MQCDDFVNRLDAFLNGEIAPPEQSALEQHAQNCERCGTLLAAMRAPVPSAAIEDAFVAELLQRTSGAACNRAQTELPEWVDGGLADFDAALVALHVQHCSGCAALATVLQTLRQDLPTLAHAEPGPEFTDAVVAATRTVRVRRTPLVARWRELWQQLVDRPRLALEVATAACFVLMLLCALPFSPLRPLPQQALAVIRFDAVTVVQSAGPVLRATAERAWSGSGARVQDAVTARGEAWVRRHTDAAALDAVRADLGAAEAGLRSGNLPRLSHALRALGIDLQRLFVTPPAETPARRGGAST